MDSLVANRWYNKVRWAKRGVFGYTAVHERLKRTFGPAKEKCCVECGGRADEWAMNPKAYFVIETTDREGYPRRFTPRMLDYMPMCKTCHQIMDWKQRKSGDAK